MNSEQNCNKLAYLEQTLFNLLKVDSILLVVVSHKLKCLSLKQATHCSLIGCQFSITYSMTLAMFVCFSSSRCVSYSLDVLECAKEDKTSSALNLSVDVMPIFWQVISRLTSTCGRGKCSKLRSEMSL